MVYLSWRLGKPPCTVHIFIPTILLLALFRKEERAFFAQKQELRSFSSTNYAGHTSCAAIRPVRAAPFPAPIVWCTRTAQAVRAPRWVGAEKEPPRQSEHANAVRVPRSAGAKKPCRRFVHRHIKAKPRFPSVFFFICGGANRSCDRLRGAHRPDGFRCPT